MARMFQWRKSNPDIRKLQRRREKTRRRLRELGILPPVGVEMDDTQKEIYKQIGEDDYTYWDTVKKTNTTRKLHDGGNQTKNIAKRIEKTPEEFILDRAKQSAQQRGLEFNLEIGDIIIPEYCPLLNVKLTFIYTQEDRDSYFSIDRIDSSKGYIKGNVQIISLKANTMKNSATEEELITFAKNILNQFSQIFPEIF